MEIGTSGATAQAIWEARFRFLFRPNAAQAPTSGAAAFEAIPVEKYLP